MSRPNDGVSAYAFRTMDLGRAVIRSFINNYGETVVARNFLCQTTCSTGPTRKTQDSVPVNATAVRIAKAQ